MWCVLLLTQHMAMVHTWLCYEIRLLGFDLPARRWLIFTQKCPVRCLVCEVTKLVHTPAHAMQGYGDQFIHSGNTSSSLPQYVDPYELLNEPTVDPYYPIQN
eukprot:jgi/Ulvmu1/12525/UM090_0012.1